MEVFSRKFLEELTTNRYVTPQTAAIIEQLLFTQDQLDAKWQSFETAPKNGTEISVWRKDAGVFTAKWTASYGDGDHGEFGMDHNGPECWFTPAGEDLSGDLPTLWQPLPPTPPGEEAVKL